MKFVGLAGGIGSGKSTVGELLARRGAEVIDVDRVSRELQEPGRPLYERIVERWGRGVLDADGRLDRAALAAVVFADRDQLTELTLMAAPYTEEEIIGRARSALGTDRVVVVETAIAFTPMYGQCGVVLVDVDPEVAVARLVAQRGMTDGDARARVASQASREERLEQAGFVVDNSGPPEALGEQVDRAWAWILSLRDAVPALPGR